MWRPSVVLEISLFLSLLIELIWYDKYIAAYNSVYVLLYVPLHISVYQHYASYRSYFIVSNLIINFNIVIALRRSTPNNFIFILIYVVSLFK